MKIDLADRWYDIKCENESGGRYVLRIETEDPQASLPDLGMILRKYAGKLSALVRSNAAAHPPHEGDCKYAARGMLKFDDASFMLTTLATNVRGEENCRRLDQAIESLASWLIAQPPGVGSFLPDATPIAERPAPPLWWKVGQA